MKKPQPNRAMVYEEFAAVIANSNPTLKHGERIDRRHDDPEFKSIKKIHTIRSSK